MLGLLGGGRFGGGDLQGECRAVVGLGADVQGAGVDGEPVGDVGQAGASTPQDQSRRAGHVERGHAE